MAAARDKVELAVVGAGPGGYAAAFLAADLGMEVALIDEEADPGGVCLYRGCIPSKALLHAAKVIGEARGAAAFGVEFGAPAIDLAKLRGWKDGVVAKLTRGLGELGRKRKVRFVRGRARFLDAAALEVRGPDGGRDELAFGHAIVATGSRPAALAMMPAGSRRVMDSTAALGLDEAEVPRRLLVIGGGYIGLELGTVYAALGSEVTVVEMMPGLLPGVDADLVRPLARRLERELKRVFVETKVAEAKETADGIRVRLEGKGIGDADAEQVFDRVLVAVGRRPNSGDLGLERTRVEVGARGFVAVNAERRTAEPAIFAIWDVAGEPMLAHKASHDGRVAVEAIAGRKVAFEPAAIPAVVFTEPEIAWCGLTEAEAAARGRAVEVTRFPWSASGRAATLGAAEGVTKLVIDPASERVLGVGICGTGAGELIAEGVLAVEMGAVASDLALSIHAHPTLCETLMEAAGSALGHATHLYRPRPKA